MTVSEAYADHITELEFLADLGDEIAIRSLACMQLIISGWRYGDPDPDDGGPDDDGGLPVEQSNVIEFPARKAA